MTIQAPGPIQRLVAVTNSANAQAFLDCFAPDALLTDWGRSFRDREEIARWNETDNIGCSPICAHSHDQFCNFAALEKDVNSLGPANCRTSLHLRGR